MDLAKMEKLVEKFAPPEMDTVGNKIEKATGMNIKDLLASINGDFTIAINGVEGESMIPIEVFLGPSGDTDGEGRRDGAGGRGGRFLYY